MKASDWAGAAVTAAVGVFLVQLWSGAQTPVSPAPASPPAPGAGVVEADRADLPSIPDPLAYDGPRLEGVAGWRADLELLRDAIPRHWSYVEHRRDLCAVDIDALVDAELATLTDGATPRDFVVSLKRVIAGLHDGHGYATLAGVPFEQAWRWPVHLMDSADGVFALGVTPELKADGAILPGDLLTTVDGVPLEDVIAEQERLTFASSDGARRVWALHHLPRSWGAESVTFGLLRDGAAREVTVDCLPHGAVVGAPVRVYREAFDPELAPGVALWRPGPFTVTDDHHDFMEQDQAGREAMTEAKRAGFVERAASLADHRAVIIDLRGNPGGTDMLGHVFASCFVAPGTVYYRLQMRGGDGRWHPISTHTVPPLPGGQEPFGGQLVLLVDEFTFSTADNVAACLVDTRDDVTVVGRPAGSGTGAPRTFSLPHSGATVSFCTMRVWTGAERMTEGQGVVPDVDVRWTIEDWLDSTRDPDLDVALAAVR